MLSSFIIVFREVLEAALVIGIVAAAVKGLPRRALWIGAGVALGVSGAAAVAASIGTVSALAHGNGQELFSAAVLLIAGAMLAWHNIWMAQHGRELAIKLKTVGADVMAGNESMAMLLIVTALAVLREGSETALFLYGIVANGGAHLDWIGGSLLGLAAGVGVGVVLFAGLSQIPLKRLFQVSGWLILFIAAGMLARGAQFLVQGGFLPPLVSPLWNSSNLISGNSLLGRSLAALLGYTPAPSLTQFLVYLVSLTLIGGFMLFKNRGLRARTVLNTLLLTTVAGATLTTADKARAGDYQVYSPNVVKGEKEIEARAYNSWGTTADTGARKAVKAAAGFIPTDYWFTELYATAEQEPGEKLKVEEAEWENRFQFTPQGKYWADLGLLSEVEIPRYSHDPYEVKVGPIIGKDFGRISALLNLVMAHQYGTNAESGVEVSYRSRLMYRYSRSLSPVIEAYGQPVGRIGYWGQPRHQIGGGVAGMWALGAGKNLRYSAVLLFGGTRAAADETAVARLEYEFF